MAKSATRVKATAQIYVPQTREDAAGDIKTIGDLNREVARLEAEMNDKIATITEEYKDKFAPLRSVLAGAQPERESHRGGVCIAKLTYSRA